MSSKKNQKTNSKSTSERIELKLGSKIWLELKEAQESSFSFGPGDLKLLKTLKKTRNLTRASEECGYSYKYAWRKLKKIKKQTGLAVVKTSKGGAGGGGNAIVTPWGEYLIRQFEDAKEKMIKTISEINKKLATKVFKQEENK